MQEYLAFDSNGNEKCACFNNFGNCGNLALNCCGDKCKNPFDTRCSGYSSSLKTYTLDEKIPPVTVRLKDVGERVEYKGGSYVCTAKIEDSGERTEFPSGAVRDLSEGKGRFDLLPMCVLMRLAKHYEAGAKKYSDRNWEKGIFAHSFADSAFRHLVKYMDGWNDEDHLIAAIWNLCGLAWTEEKKPEYMDIPARKEIAND